DSPGGLCQIVTQAAPESVSILDAPGATASDLSCTPFDLSASPPFRAEILRTGEGEHLLRFVVHRILCDGLSLRLLLAEVAARYAAPGDPRWSREAPKALQYADYAVWERGWLTGQTLARQSEFWRDQLRGAHDTLLLPADHPRRARAAHRPTP